MKPILFSLGPLDIYAFGLCVAIGFLIATFIIWRYGRDERLPEDKILDAIFIVTSYALLAGRFGYMLLHFAVFSPNLLRFFLLWKFPGLSLGAGVLGGIFGLLVASRRKKLTFWQLADHFSFGIVAFLILGALAGLLDGSEVGRVTQLPWGVWFAGHQNPRHPLGLYEMIIAGALYPVLLQVKKKGDKDRLPHGVTSLIGGFVLSLLFFVLAFLKEDSLYLGGFSFNQVVFGILLCVIPFLLYKRIRKAEGNELPPVWDSIKRLLKISRS